MQDKISRDSSESWDQLMMSEVIDVLWCVINVWEIMWWKCVSNYGAWSYKLPSLFFLTFDAFIYILSWGSKAEKKHKMQLKMTADPQ